MKGLDELIDNTNSGWHIIKNWISESNKHVNILSVNKANADKILLDLQITTKSFLGAVVYETGGIIFDHGWLRILGSGSDALSRTLSSWNKIDLNGKSSRLSGSLLIGDDILGGFFALNGGAFKGELGNIFYFAPDTLEWEDLEMKYSDFLYWAFVGDIEKYYHSFRWDGWKTEISKISGDQGISVYPFLWANGEDIAKRSKAVVPIEELWELNMEYSSKIK